MEYIVNCRLFIIQTAQNIVMFPHTIIGEYFSLEKKTYLFKQDLMVNI